MAQGVTGFDAGVGVLSPVCDDESEDGMGNSKTPSRDVWGERKTRGSCESRLPGRQDGWHRYFRGISPQRRCQLEGSMAKLVFVIALFLMVPTLRARQAETNATPPQTAPQATPQPAAQNPSAQDNLPASIRPGHPLDPADVDILTGKRDREIEAARRTAVPVMVGGYGEYGYYGDYYLMNGRRGAGWDMPMLPLSRIANPFFFSRISPREFGRGGIHGGR
jgi:hypothetical protein